MSPKLPQIWVGDAETEPEMGDVEGMDDDSDEELETTPPDVVEQLGFDPKELDFGEDDDDATDK